MSYRPYRRDFSMPLQTAHGEWEVREGFILRVESERGVGYSEVAPIPEFGTETVERAANFLEQWVADSIIIPSGLPCCSFAQTTAIHQMEQQGLSAARDYSVAALLPSGPDALPVAGEKISDGYRTLKWKIGVFPFEAEQEFFRDLLELLTADIYLRLDANGGLSPGALESWLEILSPHSKQIEYLEQPLPPGEERLMAESAKASGIRIALDESLNLPGCERWLTPGGWDGPLVIKPLLMGNVTQLMELLKPLARQLVFSSVFETGIGLSQALSLADALPEMNYAIGFDTFKAFDDELSGIAFGPVVAAEARAGMSLDAIWNQLQP
ncbi:MAG: o-succinylbenzoate synthase [Opitutales bacterium]